MRHFKYLIIGGIIGLIAGAFFGLISDSFYTKKSQRATKATIQVYLFGGIGVVVGISLGFKVASEEEKSKQKELEYQRSIIETDCRFCEQPFQYSTLHYTGKKYCNNCILKIREDYFLRRKEISKILLGIEKLKRPSAINSRLDKVKQIAEGMAPYDNIELDFISKKSSEILRSIEDYRCNLDGNPTTSLIKLADS